MILNYFELTASFDLAPAEAVVYYQQKGLKTSYDWRDVTAQEHRAAFTVAKMMDTDLLSKVKLEVDKAIANGTPLAEFKKSLIPTLQKAGWWGRADTIDPLTGEIKTAQLGSASRLETIFRTNLQNAYAAGRWEAIQTSAEVMPYLLYDAVDDSRTRPEHERWDGMVLPVESAFWDTHYPPNGWNCRCGVIQMTDEDVAEEGLKVAKEPLLTKKTWVNPRTGKAEVIPHGLDPGWNHNPGKIRLAKIDELAIQKAINLGKAEKAVLAEVEVIRKKAHQEAIDEIKNDDLLKALSEANAEGALERHMARFEAKLPNLKAQKEIDALLADQTPFLAAAIKAVQKTKASQGMSPSEILEKAKAKAKTEQLKKAKQSWLNAKVKGKEPSAGVNALIDTLPDDELVGLWEKLDDLKGNTQAKLDLKAIAAGTHQPQASYKKKAFTQLSNSGDLEGLEPVDVLALVLDKAQAKIKADSISKGVSGYKKNVLAGKIPTDKQKAAWDSLDETAKAKHLADIEAKSDQPPKISDQPQPKSDQPPELRMDNMTQIGGQGGSNPGGLYQDTTTGKKYYIKTPASEDIARNEVLAAKLYQAAGIDAPDYHIINDSGTIRIASEFVEGLESNATALQKGATGVSEGFAIDAWLANWDVVGLGFDNLLVKGGKAFRIDTGGALRYRAQGSLKGAAWGDEVLELDSLRNPSMNPQAASVFGKLSTDQVTESARKVAAVTDETIDRLVNEWSGLDAGEAAKLKATLKARRENILDRYPGARSIPEPELAIPAGNTVTSLELKQIEAARVNGYTILTDKDAIEDHNVRFTHLKDAQGQDITRVSFRLTAPAKSHLLGMAQTGNAPVIANLAPLKAKFAELMKGVGMQYKNGEALRDKDLARYQEFLELAGQAQQKLAKEKGEGKAVSNFIAHLVSQVDGILKGKAIGDKVTLQGMIKDPLPIEVLGKVEATQQKQLSFSRRQGSYHAARFSRSHQRLTEERIANHWTDEMVTEIDGVEVRLMDSNKGYYIDGMVYFDIPGKDLAAANRAFKVIEDLEIDASRATADDRRTLMLNAIAHRRFYGKDTAKLGEYRALKTLEERVAWYKNLTGKDVTKSRAWNELEAATGFGHGRKFQYRADMEDNFFNQVTQGIRLYHNPNSLAKDGGAPVLDAVKAIVNGGGSLTSLLDRVRRGLPESKNAASYDYADGGGAYVFTRVVRPTHSGTGFIWKSERLMARTDRVTYAGDKYGDVRTAQGQHIDHPENWSRLVNNSSDETIFKDGLSLFEDLDYIQTSGKADRQAVIDFLKSEGYSIWPDGRPVEKVVR